MGNRYANPNDVIYSDESIYATISASGDETVISAPGADKEIYIKEIQIQAEADGDNIILFKRGSTTFRRIKLISDGDGWNASYPSDNGVHVGENVALVINLSAALATNYYIHYEVRAPLDY